MTLPLRLILASIQDLGQNLHPGFGVMTRSAFAGTMSPSKMDKLKKVTGTWRGTFGYDPIVNMPERARVSFTLTLKQGWFGHIKGSVIEHGTGATPGTGMIEGYFSFPKIELIKWMPVCYVTTPTLESLSLREWLIREGHSCEHDVPHPPIFYRGEFSSRCKAQGIWFMKPDPISLPNGLIVDISEATGSWSLETADRVVTH